MSPEEREHFERIESERGYVLARLRLAPTEDDGRKSPLRTGYRAMWHLGEMEGDVRVLHDAPITVDGAEWLAPGDVAIVRLHPLVPELWPELRPGQSLGMFEGSTRVGTAVVLGVVPTRG